MHGNLQFFSALEHAGRYPDIRRVSQGVGYGRATGRAEVRAKTGRLYESRNVLFAGEPAEILSGNNRARV